MNLFKKIFKRKKESEMLKIVDFCNSCGCDVDNWKYGGKGSGIYRICPHCGSGIENCKLNDKGRNLSANKRNYRLVREDGTEYERIYI